MGNSQQVEEKAVKKLILNPQKSPRQKNLNTSRSKDNKNHLDSTRINTSRLNDTDSRLYNGSGSNASSPRTKRKRQVILSKNPNQANAQIYNAKKNYQAKKLQNQVKLTEIRQKIDKYNKIYRDEQESEQQNPQQQNQQEKVIIWGKKVTLKKGNPMQQYYKYRYPKQRLMEGEQDYEYRNWDMYKDQMSRAKFNQLYEEQQKLMDQVEQLRWQYESLLQQKNRQKQLSMLSPNSRYIQYKLELSDSEYNREQVFQKIDTPQFKHSHFKNFFQSAPTQFSKTIRKRKSNSRSPSSKQRKSMVYSNIDRNYIRNDNWQHPQNIVNSDPQYLAKQMHYFENYIHEKKSSYMPLKYYEVENQYPAKKRLQKPNRNEDTITQNYLYNLKKTRRKKSRKYQSPSKSKSKSKSKNMSQFMYEKLPSRKYPSFYKNRQQNLLDNQPFYYANTSRHYQDNYRPQRIEGYSPSKRELQEGELCFHYISKQKQYDDQWENRINLDDFDVNDPKKKARRINYHRRQVEWKILEKVRHKNL